VHLPELTLRPSRQRRFMRQQRVGFDPPAACLKITRTSLVCWRKLSMTLAERAQGKTRSRRRRGCDGSFVGAGMVETGWVAPLSRWSDLTMQLAGLRRSDLRRDKN